MASDRVKLSVTVLVEHSRTRSFMRELLKSLGFHPRKVRFQTAPSGEGSAERWVVKRYPPEVQVLRTKKHLTSMRLIAVRDGDKDGLVVRKAGFDLELEAQGKERLQPAEKIALLVPTWSIETWLLALLGEDDIEESKTLKTRFDRRASSKKKDIRAAAIEWPTELGSGLSSLTDGRGELQRIGP